MSGTTQAGVVHILEPASLRLVTLSPLRPGISSYKQLTVFRGLRTRVNEISRISRRILLYV